MSRFLGIMCLLVWGVAAQAQQMTGLARVDAGASSLRGESGGAELVLALSQPVPWRVFTLDDPRRLVLDFSVVDWAGFDAAGFAEADLAAGVRVGALRPGWSRMVIDLSAPATVARAWMEGADPAMVRVQLQPASAADFAAAAGASESALFALPDPATDLPPPHRRQDGSRPVVVVLDPGHGGIDPGAERDAAVEAHLMLTFARELREVLQRAGGFDVVLTRDADIFVPLETRVSLARQAGADVFISLHADALSQGRARGATIYTLSEEASDVASEKLAERHDRGDLLAGVDLSENDDGVARVLMELARTETAPRSDRLAEALVAGLSAHVGPLYKHPRLEASFSVLKAADIPSVLIELGFLSSEQDRTNLMSRDWRGKAAQGIRDALIAWAKADAAEAALLRQ